MRHVTLDHTYESEQYTVEFSVYGFVYPGEREVRYTANGDGYPGSPPEYEIMKIEITAVYNPEGEKVPFNVVNLPYVRGLLEDWCEDHFLDLSQEAFEILSEREYND